MKESFFYNALSFHPNLKCESCIKTSRKYHGFIYKLRDISDTTIKAFLIEDINLYYDYEFDNTEKIVFEKNKNGYVLNKKILITNDYFKQYYNIILKVRTLPEIVNKLNLYELLECKIDSTKIEIKKNFMKQSKKFHPDKNMEYSCSNECDNCYTFRLDKQKYNTVYYQNILKAYKILYNPGLRLIYDITDDINEDYSSLPEEKKENIENTYKKLLALRFKWIEKKYFYKLVDTETDNILYTITKDKFKLYKEHEKYDLYKNIIKCHKPTSGYLNNIKLNRIRMNYINEMHTKYIEVQQFIEDSSITIIELESAIYELNLN